MRLPIAVSGSFVTLLSMQAIQLPAAQGPQVEVREFKVLAQRYEFIPDHIEADEGDHVRFIVRSADGTHGFAIRSFGIREELPRTGDPVSIDLEATRAGTYEITCSEYCGRGHSAMRAMFIVRPMTDRGKAR